LPKTVLLWSEEVCAFGLTDKEFHFTAMFAPRLIVLDFMFFKTFAVCSGYF
jgi:hypothetical protein